MARISARAVGSTAEQDRYVGEWSGDKREGQGVCTFANGDVYTGGWHSDLREGYGVLPYANGDRYEGDWHEDMRWGKGRQTYATGCWYDGEWLNDIENGTGKAFLQTPQRGVFEGTFKDGLPNGSGKFAYANGDVYEGEILDGVRCGYGKLISSVGAVYEGGWEGDQRHGQGTQTWPNGDSYTGQWIAGVRMGQGSMKYGNGDIFTGEWKDNQRVQGHCVYSNGDDYDGEFVEDERTGIGRCRFSNGDVYEGEWCQDLPQGEGMCTYANGDAYTGMFAGGMREGEGEVMLGDYSEEFLARSVYRGGWKNDRYSGLGSMIEANGDRYDGVWVDGKRQGRGTQRFVAAGERYQGIWLRDQRHGRGRHFYSDGTLYDGQWRNGCRDGKGKCVYKSDSRIGVSGVYDGFWKRDKKDGRGTFEFDNGDLYNGQWRNDMRNGTGTCNYHTGEEYSGEWVEDVRKGSGDEMIPRVSTGADWAMQSLRIIPEEARPRVPRGGVAIVKEVRDLGELKPASGELPKVSGKVVDPRGAMVKDVTITVQPTLNSLSRSLEVDDEGGFEIVGLPERGLTLSLALRKPGYATLQTTCSIMPTCEQSNSIEVMLAPLPEPRTDDKVTLRDTFDSSEGVSIQDARNNSVVIPKDALCTADGIAYDGTAEVCALPIDATAKSSFSKMPSFEGRDLDCRMCLVDLYGAMYVEIRAVPSGEELGIRGGKHMQLGFASKVPLDEKYPPSAWAYEQQAGFWKETSSTVLADSSALEGPSCGNGFGDEEIYSAGSSKGQDLADWAGDAAEFLGSGPKVIRRALTPSPAPTPEPLGDDTEAEADAEDPPEAKPPQYENVVVWKTTRFKGTGTVPKLVYKYTKEQAALDTSDGDVESSVNALSENGSRFPAEVRMVQHLVIQNSACAKASLTTKEIVAALQERSGQVKDAANRLSTTPIVMKRSLVAEVKEAAEQTIPFASITVTDVLDALNRTRDDSAAALQVLVDQNAGKEESYHQLCEVLTTLGSWNSKAEIYASLIHNDFVIDAAAAELTGIQGISTATWCKGQLSVVEAYKRAKVVAMLGITLKFCSPDAQAIEIALSLTSGSVEPAVDGLVKEWLGLQMVLQTKAQLMKASMPWADIAADKVKAALQEHGKREPAMQALVEEWQPHKDKFDQVFSALEAVNVTKPDAEICAALATAEFDVTAATAALSSRDDAIAESNKVQVMEGLQDKYDFCPIAEADILAKLEEHGGDASAVLEALYEELAPDSVEADQTWWMKSYRTRVNAATKPDNSVGRPWQASLQVDSCGWWSCSKPVPAGLVTGRMVNGSEVMGAAYVQPIGEDYRGWSTHGRCRTGDGSFAVVAPSSAAVRLKVAHAAFDGLSPAFHTSFPGSTTDLGVVDIQAFAQPDAGSPAPRFSGKRSVKDDVLKQREADSARLVELSHSVRTVLSSVGMWRSDIQIGAELAQRAMSVERVVVSLSRDSEILTKYSRHQIRSSIYSEFGIVPLLEDAINSALVEANGSEAAALAKIRIWIIKEFELQARRASFTRLRQTVGRILNLIGPVLKLGNDDIFKAAYSLEKATALTADYVKSGKEFLALQIMEYGIYRELQENATMLSPAWKEKESVENIMHAKIYNIVSRYNRLASTYCASGRYVEALELLRKADFITAQPTLLTTWEDRMKIGTITQNNLGALFRRRGDTASAQAAFDRGFAMWNAADLSGPTKFPLNLKPETPISLRLNSSANLFSMGKFDRAFDHAEKTVGAMLAMAGAVDAKLESKAQKAAADQKRVAADLIDLEAKVEVLKANLPEGAELERATVVELETLTTAAKDAAKERLSAAVLARTTCWANFDKSGAPADFSRVLATAHACAADAAFALAAKVETKLEEENPGPGEGEELFSLAERAVLHSSRAAALAATALGDDHALTVAFREKQQSAKGDMLWKTNCMYMQVPELSIAVRKSPAPLAKAEV